MASTQALSMSSVRCSSTASASSPWRLDRGQERRDGDGQLLDRRLPAGEHVEKLPLDAGHAVLVQRRRELLVVEIVDEPKPVSDRR
ncbi:MAG: hypothetical protein WDM88_07060 [Galbitalea sp.]